MSQSVARTDEYIEENDDGTITRKRIPRIDLSWEGTKLILPNGMDVKDAIKALEKKLDEDEQRIRVHEVFRAFPADGVVALQKALRDMYGWTNLEPTPGFYGSSPPHLIPVNIGYDETVKVPWGHFSVPNIKGKMISDWTMDENLPKFVLAGEIRRADENVFNAIVEATKRYIREESIYRGQAIKLTFRDSDGDRVAFSPDFSPRFMDLKSFDPSELVLPEMAREGVRVNLWNPIEFSEYCRLQNIPLKRGVLLEGGFGTGKTLTAFQTAQLCVNNGWTFLMLDDVRDIHEALMFARLYEPCVIFAEDVDKAVAGNRTDALNRIFNTIDGIESKGHDIMTVLTTNEVGNINPGFIRPGRIDAVITVGPPDNPAIVQLVRRYAQNGKRVSLLSDDVTDEDIVSAMQPVVGANAAFIREVVERAKLAAIGHADGSIEIKSDDLAVAARSMKTHLELVNPKDDTKLSAVEEAGEALMDEAASRFVQTLADPVKMKRVLGALEKVPLKG